MLKVLCVFQPGRDGYLVVNREGKGPGDRYAGDLTPYASIEVKGLNVLLRFV